MSGIAAALAAVMADCDHVAKRDRNNHDGYAFRGIDAVLNAVGPILRRHGVIVLPTLEDVTYATVHTSTGKPASACRVVVTFTFIAEDGSTLAAKVPGEAWDRGDKAVPKAMSVAFRTALIQSLALPTDEPDPDSHTYEQQTPPLDVDAVLAACTTPDEVREAWTAHGIGSAPQEVRDRFTARAAELGGGGA